MDRTARMFRHFRKIENKSEKNQIRNIDFIYLINLDIRPEKLEKSLQEFAPYDIHPHRVPGIVGWGLPQETFNDIAMPVLPATVFDRPVHFRPEPRGAPGEWLDATSVGRRCVHHTMNAGQLGCYLSHLSVLSDAYDSNYQTIWVLEDDVTIAADPHILADYIDELDALIGPGGWDMIYTDNEEHFYASNLLEVMGGGALGRPGIPLTEALLEYRRVSPNFFKIGGRHHTHSMIIRRSGIEKILTFVIENGMFRPNDIENAFVPDIKFYQLSHDVVHGRNRLISDTSKPPEQYSNWENER